MSPTGAHLYLFVFSLFIFLHERHCVIDKKSWGQRKITVKSGVVRGVTVSFSSSIRLKNVEAFLGVDYGSLKRNILFTFHPPSDPIPNRKVDFIDSSSFKGVCPQPFEDPRKFHGKETTSMIQEYLRISKQPGAQTDDCLSLNIYSPIPGIIFIFVYYFEKKIIVHV